ncbi:hypothetical protein NE237_019252 [Protea cynaroides]|uniref:Uncharacterized protein n=1 Tax=Protea cynaroides TaxID=273540 RepID=A0A9Q0KBC9_9MAGN|nr:hypothetical protein NE237_019252 [Protea cynaroides]
MRGRRERFKHHPWLLPEQRVRVHQARSPSLRWGRRQSAKKTFSRQRVRSQAWRSSHMADSEWTIKPDKGRTNCVDNQSSYRTLKQREDRETFAQSAYEAGQRGLRYSLSLDELCMNFLKHCYSVWQCGK